MYRFRYRSKNINGYSAWSPITYVKASTVPSRPPAPVFKTSSADSVTLTLYSSTENKGSEITNLEIWRNLGGTSLSFVLVASLQSSAKEFEIKVADSVGMQVGVIYKFKVRTINAEGPSEYSEEVDAAASSFPAQPSPPTRILSQST